MIPYLLVAPQRLAGVTAGDEVQLDATAHHHLARVLRRREGSAITVADGSGVEVRGTLHGQTVTVGARRVVDVPAPRIEVAQALGKGRKHDDVVRMLTEVGVDRITAITTRRTTVDLTGKAGRVRERWQAVADAACAQARRARRPVVDGPLALPAFLARLADPIATPADSHTRLLVAVVGATGDPLSALRSGPTPGRVVVVIGPEGGLADDEVDRIVECGGEAVTLGATVLRTEHAGLVAAGVVAAATGRMVDESGGPSALDRTDA